MDAIARLDDQFARIGMTLLRGTGLRLGELLDLELDWLNSEMLKTRVAHGYCSRQLAAEACPYANICEQCDNFVTAPNSSPPSRPSSPTPPPSATTRPNAAGTPKSRGTHASSPASKSTSTGSPGSSSLMPLRSKAKHMNADAATDLWDTA